MFSGYGFFDYKYDIQGYSGQDYNGPARFIYIGLVVVLTILFLILFRKAKKEQVDIYLKVLGIFMVAIYIIKTTWESIYDIARSGQFNVGILPFDTCSIVMWAGLLAGFGKGKLKKIGECWLSTGGLVGGISAALFLQAFNYYPFFTFGAFYSMLWHLIMVFTGFFLIVVGRVELNMKTVIYGYVFHFAVSLVVIPLNYFIGQDFMLYKSAGGAPLMESFATLLINNHLDFLVPIIMLIVYFGLFVFIIYFSLAIKLLIKLITSLFVKKEETVKQEE